MHCEKIKLQLKKFLPRDLTCIASQGVSLDSGQSIGKTSPVSMVTGQLCRGIVGDTVSFMVLFPREVQFTLEINSRGFTDLNPSYMSQFVIPFNAF